MRIVASPARGGFTLIEISVVVLIIALMLTTVTVSLDGFLPSTRTESAARQLLATLDLARTSSVSFGRHYEVEIDLDRGRYRILTPFDEDGDPARSPQERVGLSWTQLRDGVTIEGIYDAAGTPTRRGIYTVPFTPSGSSTELSIHFQNSAGPAHDLTARISALTGQTQVLQGFELPQPLSEDDFL